MNKLLLAAILSLGIAMASTPVMAKHGADDPAGHDVNEHGGGHEAAEHGGGHEASEHGGGHDAAGHEAKEANEAAEHAAGHDVNDDDTPPPAK